MKYVQNFPRNEHGRDFVIADLHGNFDVLSRFLYLSGFNPSSDRMFCTGDVIDRGRNSLDCAELMFANWFNMVRGNHEQMMLDTFEIGQENAWHWLQNGGDWAYPGLTNLMEIDKSKNSLSKFMVRGRLDLTGVNDAGHRLLNIVWMARDLPYVINIDCDWGMCTLVHAELPNIPISKAEIRHEEFVQYLATNNFGTLDSRLLWGRSQFDGFMNTALTDKALSNLRNWVSFKGRPNHEDLDMIFCGHTIVKEPILLGNVFNQDTAAYHRTGYLTVTELNNGLTYKVREDSKRLEVQVPRIL